MNDPIDDMLLARAAGTGPQFDGDTSFMYPPHPHAAQPGHMPTVLDTVNRMHTAEARVTIVESELESVMELLKAHHEADPEDWNGRHYMCRHCDAFQPGPLGLADHKPDCPWRLTDELLQKMEVSNG
jgi:hypothetical protein